MPIDPRISLGVQPLQVADPMARYGQMQNILAAQSQQQMSQMQLEQMRRDETTLKQIQTKAMQSGGPSDLNQIAEAYLNSGNPKFVEFGVGLRQKLDEQAQFAKIMGLGSTPAPAMPNVAPAPGALGSGTFDPNAPVAAPMPTQAQRSATATGTDLPPTGATNRLAPAPVAPVNQLAPVTDVSALRRKRDALLAMGTNQSIAAARAIDADIALASKESPDAMLMQKLGYPLTQAGYQAFRDAQRQDRLLTSEEEKQKIKIAAASRAPAQPPQPQPPVAVIDPLTNKQVFVSREEALSKRMTPAAAMEGLPPKEIQAREAKFPAATSAVKTFESSAEKLAADLERLATHPGLSGISGLIYGRTPAVTKEARAAQALYDSIVARGGFQELQNMRASSPTGGALGNVSNQEGQYLRDAFAPINRTQDTADLSRSLTEAANATRSSKQRVREAYDMTYDYKNQGGATAPAAGGKVVDFGSLK
jgi:hypothetical protein